MLYAAGWLVGEYCHHLISHQDTLQALIRGMIPSLPPHIQAVYIQAAVKIYTDCGLPESLMGEMVSKLEGFATSSDLEVQERAGTSLQLLRFVTRQRDKLEEETFVQEMKTFFTGELNPVGPKAQKKVPVPEGLDLDAWINEPQEDSEEEEDEEEDERAGGDVFVKEDKEAARRKVVEPSEEELEASRQARLNYQSANPNYLKDATPKASPSRGASRVAEIPIQEIDLDVPLHIPGLANTDSYFNLSQNNSEPESKKGRKKKKKKSKKAVMSSEEDEEAGPNVFVSQSLDMPEGATMSDPGSEDNDNDDPHRALSNIVLDDILEEERAKTERKSKKKKKAENGDPMPVPDLDNSRSPELVEHKIHKHKKKKKSKKPAKSAEEDLLGLSLEPEEAGGSGLVVIGETENLKVEVNPGECRVEEDGELVCSLLLTNVGPSKLSQLTASPANSPVQTQLTKSLKPGNASHFLMFPE